ncbi:MAG: beta-lactamase family protein [Thiotrichales bacterium]|nr:MAG: beta-lactamase family protein [Thiotrichales bacterium]
MPASKSGAAILFAFGFPVLSLAADTSFEQLIADLDKVRTEHEVAGFALTVVSAQHGVKTATGGVADRESGRAVTADTLFRIGSITKTFNALAIMLLVEQGRVELKTPVRDIVSDAPFENPWAETHPVRVGHLLEHSSGLLDLTRDEFDHNRPFPTLEAAFAWRPKARIVQWPPGWHHVYSNANAGLAGLVIERVSGRGYADFITEQLLEPLGMTSASLVEDETTRRRLATGYDTDGKTPIPYWHMIFPPLGAINATPPEMAALVELFLGRGLVGNDRLLDAASIDRMEQPVSTLGARQGLRFGYGPGLDQALHGGFVWYGHGGDGDGYLSRFGYSREADAGYFLTINAFNHEAIHQMRDRVQDYLTRDLKRPQPAPVSVEADQLRRLTGIYVAITRRFEWQTTTQMDADRLEVVFENGTLYTRTAKGQRELIPVDAQLFRRESHAVATIAITEQEGDLYLQAEFGNYQRMANP